MAQPSVTAAPLVSSATPVGLTPEQVRRAYGVNQVSFQGGSIAGDGSGQTIAIVTAYLDPNIASDLATFDRTYGLPAPPSFQKYVASGLSQTDPGWSLETALDVEWAHAIAPKANIVLVEAKSASVSDLFSAVNFARSLNGVVAVSMSWGAGEFYGENALDSILTTPAGHIGGSGLPGGVTFVAASGDTGAWSGVSYPAASPNVLSVGATALNPQPNGSYGSETGWTDSTGGFSALEPAPSYQANAQSSSGLSSGLRSVPDVSMVGDPATGVSVYSSVSNNGQSGWFAVGGTSASTPQWAGLIALADQGLALSGKGSLSDAQAALYSLPSTDFHPVSTGFNGYSAVKGYNLVAGLGTPIANRVISGLIASQTNASITASTPASATPGQSHSSPHHSAQRADVLSSDSNSSITVLPSSPGTTVVVVVVTSSTGQLIGIVPVLTVAPPPQFTTTGHPAPAQTLITSTLATDSHSTLDRFGQTASVDNMLSRPVRLDFDAQLASMIDVVEPFQVDPRAGAPGLFALRGESIESAQWVRSGPTEKPADLSLRTPIGPVDLPSTPIWSGEETVPRDLISPPARIEESGTSAGPRVASTAALAIAGYWLTLKDRDDRKRAAATTGRSIRPAIRRFHLPPR
jgi:subtilase family serine protease